MLEISRPYCSAQASLAQSSTQHLLPTLSPRTCHHCIPHISFHYRAYSEISHTGEAFGLEGLGKTYLSLDVDGRVVRLDSFSKFLAPGMRLGWVTAHPDMLQKICFALHASTMGPCSFTQVPQAPLLSLHSCMHPCLNY